MPETGKIIIKPGDTLSGIAKQYSTTVSELMRINPQIKDPNLIYAGASLNIPISPQNVQKGITPTQTARIAELQKKIDETKKQIANLSKQVYNKLLEQSNIPKDIDVPYIDLNNLNAYLSSMNLRDLNQSFLNMYQPLIDMMKEEIELRKLAREERKGWMQKMMDFLTRKTKTEELLEAREKEDIEALMAERKAFFEEAKTLQDQITKVMAERDAALATAEGRMAPISFIRGQQAQINRMYEARIANLNAQLGYKMAMYQAKSGEIDEARRWINDLVNAATYDKEFDLRTISMMLNLYNDEYEDLSSDLRRNLTNLVSLKQDELNSLQASLRNKMNILLQAARVGAKIPSWQEVQTMTEEELAHELAKQISEVVEAVPRTDYERTQMISEFLEARKGKDKLVSAETYQEALSRWISYGGTRADFLTVFPIVKWLGSWEWKKLSPDLRREVPVEVTGEQVKIWLQQAFTEDILYQQAQASGFTKGWRETKKDVVNKYLDSIATQVDKLKELGFTGEQIMRMIIR